MKSLPGHNCLHRAPDRNVFQPEIAPTALKFSDRSLWWLRSENDLWKMGEKLRLIHRRCFRLRLFGLKIDLIEFEFGLSDSARRSVDTPAENIEQIYNRYGVKVFVYNDREAV